MEERSIYDLEPPKSEGGLYLKIEPGATEKLRFIGKGITWQKQFDDDEKPSARFASIVLHRNQSTKASEPKVWEFGWGVQKQLAALLNDEDWGDLEDYDVAITRTGEKKETRYTVIAKPKKPMTDDEKQLIADAGIDLRKACKVGVQEDGNEGEYDPFPGE